MSLQVAVLVSRVGDWQYQFEASDECLGAVVGWAPLVGRETLTKSLLAVVAASVVLSSCAAQRGSVPVVVNSAFVYEYVGDSDPGSRQLGLDVDACNGDYEVDVDETADALQVTVHNWAPSVQDCSDSFTVHIDAPPHGKIVVDNTTGKVISVQQR